MPHGQTERSSAAIRERVRGVASPGIVASRGTPMRRLIESGAVLGRHFVQEPGGMLLADLLRVVQALAQRGDVAALDVVEVAPAYHQGRVLLRNLHVPWLVARATSPPGEPVLV